MPDAAPPLLLDLASRLRAVNPDLKVILMSGYHEESGDDLEDVLFLTKPFSVLELATHVRTFLDDQPVLDGVTATLKAGPSRV